MRLPVRRTPMKAAVLTRPGRFELREVPVPECGPDDVLVRVSRVGVRGTDVHVSRGHDAVQAFAADAAILKMQVVVEPARDRGDGHRENGNGG